MVAGFLLKAKSGTFKMSDRVCFSGDRFPLQRTKLTLTSRITF